LAAQIDRLLTLPAVKANLTNIVIDWFNVRQMFDKGNKDTSLLSALATADRDQTMLTADLYAATQQLVNDVLWTSRGTVNDLVTSQKVFLNKRLSTLYPGVTFASGAPTIFALPFAGGAFFFGGGAARAARCASSSPRAACARRARRSSRRC